MLRAALRYPTRGDEALTTALVGGGCHLAAAFVPVVPLVFVAGYLVRVLDHVAAERGAIREAPPTFESPLELVRRGLGASLVVVAYLVVPVTVLVVTLGGAVSRRVPSLGLGTALGVAVGGVVTLFVALPFVYLLPAALTRYALTGRLRGAFERRPLVRAGTSGSYLVAVATTVGIATVLWAVVPPLNAVALGFFVAFPAEVVAAAVCARAVGEAW